MKYIDSEKITAKIDGIIDGLKRNGKDFIFTKDEVKEIIEKED